jgi:fibronectin type 3 domain-containing protein
MRRLLALIVLLAGVAWAFHSSVRPLRAATSGHNVVLTWTASTSAATYPTGTYSVFRGTTAGGESTTAYATGIANAATTWTDTAVTANDTYYYKVTFCVGSVCSAYSNETSATVPLASGDLAAPTGAAATAQ